MAYRDMFTVLVVDSRIKRSRSLNDAFEHILGCLPASRRRGSS